MSIARLRLLAGTVVLIILTTVEMAVVPGVGLLYGSLNGPVIQNVFQQKNLPLSFFEYAEVMALPTSIVISQIGPRH